MRHGRAGTFATPSCESPSHRPGATTMSNRSPDHDDEALLYQRAIELLSAAGAAVAVEPDAVALECIRLQSADAFAQAAERGQRRSRLLNRLVLATAAVIAVAVGMWLIGSSGPSSNYAFADVPA